MKTVVYFSDFTQDLVNERAWKEAVQRETGAGQVFAVMSGNYLQNGLPAAESVGDRAQRAMAAGVDMVLEMSLYASLSSIGIYGYSAARMMDKLGCVDELVLETEDATLAQLTEAAFVLIGNSRDFSQKVSHFKKSGLPFYKAQARAMADAVEDGERIMSSWYNIFAVECIKALKIMYSNIKCRCVPKRDMPKKQCHVTQKLSDYLEYQICFSKHRLSDIYGGYEALTESILKNQNSFESFLTFADKIAGNTKDLFDIRKYFLRLLCGMMKSDVSIWRMYDFSPYGSVYTGNKAVFEAVSRLSNLLLLFKEPGKENDGLSADVLSMLNRSKQELWEMERQAQKLYQLQMKER